MNGKTPPAAQAAATENSRRAAYIRGLHALADVLGAHKDMPLPYQGDMTSLVFHFLDGEDPRTAMAATARAIPCNWRKHTRQYEDGSAYFDMDGELEGVKITLTAFRDAVCERVVTGSHTETRTVKDPAALATVPEIEVTEVVEDVKWVCHPVLAPEGPAAA